MNFGEALRMLKKGCAVARKGWNGKGMYLSLQYPDEHSKMERPYIYIVPGPGGTVPWVASQADLLSDDWEIVSRLDGPRETDADHGTGH